jgi:O-antigen ligase
MNLRAGKLSPTSDSLKTIALFGGLLIGAVVLGMSVATAGGGSTVSTLAIGGMILLSLGAFVSWALELPVIGIVRYAFIASFFFKGDLTIFKVDEIEDPSGLNLSITLILGLVLVAYDYFTDDERERVFPGPFSILLAALFVCAVVSVVVSGSTSLGGFSLLSLCTSILITYATASHFARHDRIVQLIVALGVGVLFTGVVAYTQSAFDWPTNLSYLGTGTEAEQSGTQSVELSRVPGFLRTPNGMAWVISCFVPVVLAPVICRIERFTFVQRIFLLAAGFAGVVAIILSLARGSWIGLAAAVALILMLGWYRLSKDERQTYFLSAGAALVLTCALLAPFWPRIYDRLTEDDQGAASIRIPLMENALRMIEANPLTGVGVNGYRTEMTRYDETGIFVSQVFPNPVHNVFAHVTVEIGIPGGMIFCLLLIYAFFECLKAMTRHDRLLFGLGLGLAVALIAFAISGFKEPASLGSVRAPMRTFFLLIGIVMALGRMQRALSAGRYSLIRG